MIQNIISKVYKIRAFSLLELSIVLIIMGTLSVVAMNLMIKYDTSSKNDITRQRLNFIEDAILAYMGDKNFFKAGLIPCPADGALAPNEAAFGFSSVGSNGVCQANSEWSNVVIGGVVPVRTLEIPDEYMFDGWGRKISYIVDQKFAVPDARCSTSCFSLRGDNGGANPEQDPVIQVIDSAGNILTNDAVYVLISHGENGYGAWTRNNGDMIYFAGASNNEIENSHTHSNGTSFTGFNNIFVQQPMNRSNNDYFDDIVVYKNHVQMIGNIATNLEPVECNIANAASAITATSLCQDSNISSESPLEQDCMDYTNSLIQQLIRICFQ